MRGICFASLLLVAPAASAGPIIVGSDGEQGVTVDSVSKAMRATPYMNWPPIAPGVRAFPEFISGASVPIISIPVPIGGSVMDQNTGGYSAKTVRMIVAGFMDTAMAGMAPPPGPSGGRRLVLVGACLSVQANATDASQSVLGVVEATYIFGIASLVTSGGGVNSGSTPDMVGGESGACVQLDGGNLSDTMGLNGTVTLTGSQQFYVVCAGGWACGNSGSKFDFAIYGVLY